MGTVTIGGTSYPIMNADLAAVDLYLKASIGPGPTAWAALVAAANVDKRGALVVEATRLLYAASWQGTPTVTDQDTAFPRDGISGVTDGTTPQNILFAECELAAALAADESIASAASSGSNVKRVKAGPVEVENFRATDTAGVATRFPTKVQRLVGAYLASAALGTQNAAYNRRTSEFDDCVKSSFDDCADYGLNGPIG